MKNITSASCLIISIVCLSLTLPSNAQTPSETPHIEVTGQGVVEAEPDLLRWDLEVENHSPNIAGLATAHTETIALVLKAIEKLGVAKDRLQTSRPKLDEHYTRRNNSTVKDGYKASTRIAFELTDINQYDTVWLELSEYGGLRIHNSTWGLDQTKLSQLQSQARLKAIENARQKAVEMAEALGMALRSPLRISDTKGVRPYPMAEAFALSVAPRNGGSGPAHASGMLAIRAEVEVVFEMGTTIRK
ncbi:MAG: DUF541 domain-containing protein [Verrucomicrobia bacterium]|nr:DUF541 domain-containing protein [Verrucomicrobiota bacterium]